MSIIPRAMWDAFVAKHPTPTGPTVCVTVMAGSGVPSTLRAECIALITAAVQR